MTQSASRPRPPAPSPEEGVGERTQGSALKKSEALGRELAEQEDARAYQRLRQEEPRTAEEWRRRREAWRAFIDDHPESPLVDRAWLELVRAGVQAWRLEGDPADRDTARADGAAYLARDDRRLGEAVREELQGLEGE